MLEWASHLPTGWAYLTLFGIVFTRLQIMYWAGRGAGRGVRARRARRMAAAPSRPVPAPGRTDTLEPATSTGPPTDPAPDAAPPSWIQRKLHGPGAARAARLLQRWGAPAVTVSVMLPGVQTAANVLAGAGRMPFPRYLPAMAVGCAVWAAFYTAGLAAAWSWLSPAG